MQSPERLSCLFVSGSPTSAYSEQNCKVMERANPIFLGDEFKRSMGVGWNRATLKTNPALEILYTQIKALNPPSMADEVECAPAGGQI